MQRQRDTQRKKLYRAEGVLQKYATPLLDTRDIEKFIEKEMKRAAIVRRYPDATKKTYVADGRGRRNACAYSGYKISMPLWSRNSWIVIHEMAHIIAYRHYGKNIAGHGWQFASVFLDLVKFIMGKDAFEDLKASFKTHKVRFTEPRKRKPLTDEQRQALVERIAMALAARQA